MVMERMIISILFALIGLLGCSTEAYRLSDPRPWSHVPESTSLKLHEKQRGASQKHLIRAHGFPSRLLRPFVSTRLDSVSQKSPPPSSKASGKAPSGRGSMPASSPPKPGPELNTSMEVRLLVPGNESSKPDFMYGVVPYSEAKRMAAGLGLDLMLLNDKQAPPIYKICDSAKFKYDQEKKRKEASKSKANEVKEILLSYDIGEHDLEVRAKAAMRFLSDGDRVRVMLRLKGREKQFVTLGAAVVDRFCGLVAPSGASVDDQTNRDDKIITKMFTPKKKS